MQDHSSIEQNRQQDIQPIDLDQCFEAFTKEEELGEEESWYGIEGWLNFTFAPLIVFFSLNEGIAPSVKNIRQQRKR